jgi:hydroxymethylpyrimidine kinase/phosphomethylpyrimidine kinase
MVATQNLPIAMTIAGSDSGGGAGIQADLKTFAALGVHGVSAITCLTAQNPKLVTGIVPSTTEMVRLQMDAILAELPPAAAKTGMLYSPDITAEVARFFHDHRSIQLVVDPVMIATSGASLAQHAALKVLTENLLPLATVVTPNLSEAEVLTGHEIQSVEALRTAAKELHGTFGCAALVKGGHLPDMDVAIDFLFSREGEWLLQAPYVQGVSTHGTGCTYAAAITAGLARGLPLQTAVEQAKNYITQSIAHHVQAAGHTVLNHFWQHSRHR